MISFYFHLLLILIGLPSYEMDASLKTLSLMAAELGATTTILRERQVSTGRKVTEVLVRKVSEENVNRKNN